MNDIQKNKNNPKIVAEINKKLDIILEIIPKTNKEILKKQLNLDIQTKSNSSDLVTNVDLSVEKMLIQFIEKKFPKDGIIAEETRLNRDVNNEYSWVIDPIDGTTNYAYRLPLFSTSIGILFENYPLGGLISIPVLNNIYKATPDSATKDNKKIRVSKINKLEQALVVTGFPYLINGKIDLMLDIIKKITTKTRGMRRTGSAAIDLAWVSEGIFTVHFEMGLKPWDTAAGVAILEAAGGKVTDFKNRPYNLQSSDILASNGILHEEIIEILSSSV